MSTRAARRSQAHNLGRVGVVATREVDGREGVSHVSVAKQRPALWRCQAASKQPSGGSDSHLRQGRDGMTYSINKVEPEIPAHLLRRQHRRQLRRRAVKILLADDEWSKKSNIWIAEQAGVSDKTVAARRPTPEVPESREGMDGRTIDTSNIGHAAEPADPVTVDDATSSGGDAGCTPHAGERSGPGRGSGRLRRRRPARRLRGLWHRSGKRTGAARMSWPHRYAHIVPAPQVVPAFGFVVAT